MDAIKAFGCAILVVLVVRPSGAAQYDVIDLGYLPNSNHNSAGSQGEGIDNAGDAAGSSNVIINNASFTHGMFYNGTTVSDLNSPSAQVNTLVNGMGPSAQVLGATGTGFAFVWTQSGGFTDLSNLGGNTGAAYGMNSLGDVVGTDTESGSFVTGVVWKSGSSPTSLTPVNSMFYASGQAINTSRTIAGFSFGPFNDVATIWTYNSGTGDWAGQSLGTLGGTGSDAYDINTAGDVVGNATRASGQGIGAFIWHPGDATLTDLDPTRAFGLNTFATGINNNNQVVGSIAAGRGFIWDAVNGIRNLQTLIDPSSPFTLTDAKDINDNGWIIGTATDSTDGLSHTVILEPASTILPGDFNQDGHVNAADISALELALTNLSAYESKYNVTSTELAALCQLPGQSNNNLNNAKLQALLSDLKNGGGSIDAVPESRAITLLALGGLTLLFARLKFMGKPFSMEPHL